MKLSVIIPVYNEELTIAEILRRVRRLPVDLEVIVVDDGSTDRTRQFLASYREDGNGTVKILYQPERRGKGAAIRRGLEEVTGDIVVIQDADLEYDPNDLLKLMRPIEEGRADVVYGSRILGRNPASSLSFYLGGRLLSMIANLLYNAGITDEPTCYKMVKTSVIRSLPLRCEGFEFCPEITARLRRRGYRIIELPISYTPRRIAEGKKIRWKDGIVAIWTLLKYRFFW